MSALIAARPKRPISLTALIDVVFILLMFFMLTSSFTKRYATTLHTATASSSQQQSEPLHLLLASNGSLFRLPDKTPINDDWLQQQNSSQGLLVYPENQTQVQTIVNTLHHLKQQGFSNVNLGTVTLP